LSSIWLQRSALPELVFSIIFEVDIDLEAQLPNNKQLQAQRIKEEAFTPLRAFKLELYSS